MRYPFLCVAGLSLMLSACIGDTTEERVATGAITGGIIGAVAGGPVGFGIGVGAGLLGGAIAPEGADQFAESLLAQPKTATAETPPPAPSPAAGAPTPPAAAGAPTTGTTTPTRLPPSPSQTQLTKATAEQAQSALQAKGLYDGPIDGIVGPRTRQAVAQFQRQEGLPATATLDAPTLQHLVGTTQPSQPQQ